MRKHFMHLSFCIFSWCALLECYTPSPVTSQNSGSSQRELEGAVSLQQA